MQNISDLSELRYYFDIGKIKPANSYFPNLPLAQRQMMIVKEQFQKFFKNKDEVFNLFHNNLQLRTKLNLPENPLVARQVFLNKVDNFDDYLFSFIKVE